MNRKNLISAAFFLLLLTATIVVIFQGNDMNTVVAAMQTLSPVYLVAAALTALFFTSAEGIMIWYLLGSLEGKTPLFSCIKYSFVGFFYSGITPSATGGQPMQLYYMQKEGHKVSDSSVVLMTVAGGIQTGTGPYGRCHFAFLPHAADGISWKLYLSLLSWTVSEYGSGGDPAVCHDQPALL